MTQIKNESGLSKPVPKWVVRALQISAVFAAALMGFAVALWMKLPAAEKVIKTIFGNIMTTLMVIASLLYMTMYDTYAAATNVPEVVMTNTVVNDGTNVTAIPDLETSSGSFIPDHAASTNGDSEAVVDVRLEAVSTNAVTKWYTNEVGSIYATLTNGSTFLVQDINPQIVGWSTNNGVVYAVTSDGKTYPTQDLSLCAAIIFAVIVIIVVVVAIIAIAKCANRLLNKTNQPPQEGPQPGGDPNDTFTGNSSNAGQTLGGGLALLRLPEGMSPQFTNMQENVARSDTATAGWTDWQGNLITSQTVLCIAPTNLAVGDKFLHIQSSTNCLDPNSWKSLTFYISMWESSVPRPSGGWVATNLIMVNYDQDMMPFATNWYRLQPTNGIDSAATYLGGKGDFPRYPDRARFYRAEIK